MTGCGWGVLYQTDRLHGDGSSAECACERITPAGGHLPPALADTHRAPKKWKRPARRCARALGDGRRLDREARRQTSAFYRHDFGATNLFSNDPELNYLPSSNKKEEDKKFDSIFLSFLDGELPDLGHFRPLSSQNRVQRSRPVHHSPNR